MKRVYIYRCNHKQGTYLYLPEKDNFDSVPKSLVNLLGDMSFSFDFNLVENKNLVQRSADEVLHSIQENGFFLQLPHSRFDNQLTH